MPKAAKPPVQWQREDVERAILGLPDVLACRVVLGAGASIGEIHVLASDGRGARYIAQDVVSVLAAQFGIDVDPKSVSVAQVASEDAMDVTPERLELVELAFISRGAEMQALAEVRFNGFSFHGKATGPASDTAVQRLVPAAVLEAAGQYFSSGRLFELHDVQTVNMAGRTVALVSVALIGRQQYRFLGSAVVGPDERQAWARAILDALNRRLLFAGPADGVGVGVLGGTDDGDQEVILEGDAGDSDTGDAGTEEVSGDGFVAKTTAVGGTDERSGDDSTGPGSSSESSG